MELIGNARGFLGQWLDIPVSLFKRVSWNKIPTSAEETRI